MSTEDPIAHACRLLREAAADLQQNSTYILRPDDWRGQPEAKAAFDEYMALADTLEAAAAQEPVATVFTMEALAPGGTVKYHATVYKPLPAGTKLYTDPKPAAQDAERIQALELEVRQLTEQIAELRGGTAYSLPEWLEVMHASEIRGIWNDCKRDGLHYVAFAWRIERLGWQRLLDALRSSRGKAPAQQPAPSAAEQVGEVPLPLLVRDIAADLGTTPIQVCIALATLGFGGHSVNMAVTPRMAKSLRAHFASTTPKADSQPAQVMEDTPPPCDQELFDQGVSVGLFDIPKWTAEALCRGIAAATEARVDWHYLGGRVHIKALPAARAPADSVLEDAAPSQAARDVLAERQRQISAKGWTPEHDDEHQLGELSQAAACYASQAFGQYSISAFWPWAAKWRKPSQDPRRNLEKAWALILAEMERIDRAARKQGRAA